MHSLTQSKTFSYKNQDIAAALCFIVAVVFFIWKAPHSYGYEDEGYYYTVAQRLMLGDSILTDEWHLAQWFTVFIYLPFKAFVYFVGSTDGIILFFRYLFIVMQCSVSAVIYYRLRKHGLFSIFAAVIYFLHIPLTWMATSHNTIGIAFVVLTGVLLATAEKFSKVICFIIGLLIAGAVLCNPSLVLIYILYTLCMIAYEGTKNKKNRIFNFSEISFSVKTWFWITIGISALALMFLIYLFSRASLKDILDNLPKLFTDPIYQITSKEYGKQNVITIQKSLLTIINLNPFVFSVYGVLMATIAFDKKRIARRPLYLSIISVIFFAYVVQIILSPTLPGENLFFWMFPLALLGLTCYSLLENKNKNIFAFLWILGALYGVCLDFSSDFAPWSSSFALAVSDISSVIFIKNIIDEMQKQNEKSAEPSIKNKKIEFKKWPIKRVIVIVIVSTLLVQTGFEFYIDADVNRYSTEFFYNAYWPSTEKLNATIEAGPLKGLKTTSNTVKLYDEILKDLDVIKEADKKANGKGPVLITGYFPWAYLYLNLPYATYSADISNYIDNSRLPQYYDLHPEKVPKYIYVTKFAKINVGNVPEWATDELMPEKALDIVADIQNEYNCTIKESSVGYIIEIK